MHSVEALPEVWSDYTAGLSCIIAGFIISLILPLLSAFLSYKPISNSACILIGSSISLPFSVTYCVITVIIFAVMTSAYLAVILRINQSDKIEKSKSDSSRVAVRLGVVILSNFIASMTVTVLSVLSLTIYTVQTLEAMVAFLLFPLNACINPMVNTILTRDFAQHINQRQYFLWFRYINNILLQNLKRILKRYVIKY